jgi:hypothetical protein
MRIKNPQNLLSNNLVFFSFNEAFQHVDRDKRPLIISLFNSLNPDGKFLFYNGQLYEGII